MTDVGAVEKRGALYALHVAQGCGIGLGHSVALPYHHQHAASGSHGATLGIEGCAHMVDIPLYLVKTL